MRQTSHTVRLASLVLLCIVIVAPLLSGASAFANSSTIHLSNLMQGRSGPASIVPWKPRPVLGPQSTLVLLIQFSNVRFGSSVESIRSLVDHVDKWFRRSSYEKMYISYTIHEDVITLPDTLSSYGAPEPGNQRGDNPSRANSYIVDVLNYVITQTSIDLSQYKHIVLIHAGGDEAGTGNPNDIWSYCDCVGPIADEDPRHEASWVLYDEAGRITHAFWGVSTFSEDEPWAVFVHEYTHSLGVSDLYVYAPDGYSQGPGVGFWSNMAAGAQLDPPVDIDGWSKYVLGWIQAVTVDSPQGEYTIRTLDSVEEPKALLIRIEGNEDEYYFVHARRKTDTDAALPSEGVIVFKINRLRERSFAGEELAILNDANPATPEQCNFYPTMERELCEPLDAPLNEKGRSYHFDYYDLSADLVLNDDGFWDENTAIAMKVRPTADGVFTITLAASPEQVGITPTSTTITSEEVTPSCVIATAAYGSRMAHDVAYMRFVRDKMIGSTAVGRSLTDAFNIFYYSWSPAIAQVVAGNSFLQGVFRILLLPLVWIVHASALSFTATASLTGSTDLASVIAFLFAASACLMVYLVGPILVVMKLGRLIRRRHVTLEEVRRSSL